MYTVVCTASRWKCNLTIETYSFYALRIHNSAADYLLIQQAFWGPYATTNF